MKEDFLHYVWKFQKLSNLPLFTTAGEALIVCAPGTHNTNAGPDFFNGQVEIDGQMWAGNIEIHIRAADWYAHQHEQDDAYDNVVLHVVWTHDVDVYRKDGSLIPTLVIKDHVHPAMLNQYAQLFSKQKKWINCENDLDQVPNFTLDHWLERLYFERLERKENDLQKRLKHLKNHWEALLFWLLCKNFGLKVNGASFQSIAESVDFSIILKLQSDEFALEALLLGQAGFLAAEKEDPYYGQLQSHYHFIQNKFGLTPAAIAPIFFRLRPPNFPTIRLSQFAALYAKERHLFSKIISASSLEEYYELFDVSASSYWDSHYNFGVEAKNHRKKLSKKFIDLLIINTILPIKTFYQRTHQELDPEAIIQIVAQVPSEENSIITQFHKLRHFQKSAFVSQALLELKASYCDAHRCLECAIGSNILGRKVI